MGTGGRWDDGQPPAHAYLPERRAQPDTPVGLDELTGLCDRDGFDARLAAHWSALSRRHARLSLLLVDVDHFGLYNASFGRPAGDECLRMLAGCLRQAAPDPACVAARIGGEEFAVILPDAAPEAAREVAERIRAGLAAAAVPHPGSAPGTVTLSIGAATRWPDPLPNAELLVADADLALYAAKAAGRDRVVCVDGGVLFA